MPRLGTPASIRPTVQPARQLRAHQKQHHRHEHDYQPQTKSRGRQTTGPRDRDDERKDGPGGGIVYRGTSQGGTAQKRPRKAALLEDVRQHRKGGDAHGDPHEQRERHEGGADRTLLRIEQQRRQHAEEIGEQDADVAHEHGRVRFLPEMAEVQLQAHDKHEQAHADLAEQLQDRQRFKRKNDARSGRP